MSERPPRKPFEEEGAFSGGSKPHFEIRGSKDDPISELVRSQLENLLQAEGEAGRADIRRTRLPPASTRQEKEYGDYECANLAERVVHARAASFVAEAGGCTCERCVCDVTALALNALPPHYLVAAKEALNHRAADYARQYHDSIETALAQACEMVAAAPRH